MKRAFGKIVKVILILLVVSALCGGGYALYLRYSDASADASADEYARVSVGLGSLSREVVSTGAISIEETQTVTAPYSVTIASVAVRSGQTVAQGDALATVDVSSLDAAIAALQTELTTIDDTLVSLAGSYSDSVKVVNPIDGRVKIIYGKTGDNVQDVVAEHGCLYVLSLDGKMRVQVPADPVLTLNASVSVTNGERTWTGTVARIADGVADITFSDASIAPGGVVTVLKNGASCGAGECEINMPLPVSSTLDGCISASHLSLNYYTGSRASMYTVANVALTQEYLDARAQREELLNEIALVRALRVDPTIYAPFSGIVSDISVSRGAAMVRDDAMMTLYVGEPDQMIISVDELDIINVSVGQSATVEMDAISDQTYHATVAYISQIGTASSGITNYSVTVKLTGDDQLKLGMNGTVSIGVGEQQNVLLVPLTALQSDAGGSYVWLYSSSHQATDEAPGVKTYVTTGLSNEDYAAVTGGLSVGDEVLTVRSAATAATSTTESTGMGGVMNFGGDGTFAMPSGGSMPSVPSGTGSGTPSMPSGTGGGSTRGTGGYPSN